MPMRKCPKEEGAYRVALAERGILGRACVGIPGEEEGASEDKAEREHRAAAVEQEAQCGVAEAHQGG